MQALGYPKTGGPSGAKAFEIAQGMLLPARADGTLGNGGPLPEFDFGCYVPESRSQEEPAGQEESGVHGAIGIESGPSNLPAFPACEEDDSFLVQSLPVQNAGDGRDFQQQAGSQVEEEAEAEVSNSRMETAPNALQCDDCELTFAKPHLLNTHRKKHNPSFKCTIVPCDLAFRYKKDLTRHQKAKHPETVDEVSLWYCHYPWCKLSFERGAGSSRKDNMERHIKMRHGG
ncbi:hypothetical protein K458DRAFT_395319 [Lentithecium fluviatile CBS 122367]|uniref:C2H2-type domain-containing protein n=1 Tax=Lentithecium fluviatile CBS 122367 TaxID=1168545 RepID=A0A6G1IJA0_9PLEO|nr:hypothetical protein K458DRAFT_395319 [Lentithecium fluviatile CBS 122367]